MEPPDDIVEIIMLLGDLTYRVKREKPEIRRIDLPTGLFLTCSDCGFSKPLGAYIAIKRRSGHLYPRCRTCTNDRKRRRYRSSEEVRRAVIAQAWRYKLRRRAEG